MSLPGEPYLDPSSGALTAFTIDLVRRPAAAAAAAAIAERSRRCLGLMAVSRGGGVPDVYSGGSIGSTARRAQGGRARDASCTRTRPSSRRHRGDQAPRSLPFAVVRDGRHSGLTRTGSASTRSSGIAALASSCCPAWLTATTSTTSWRLQPRRVPDRFMPDVALLEFGVTALDLASLAGGPSRWRGCTSAFCPSSRCAAGRAPQQPVRPLRRRLNGQGLHPDRLSGAGW